MQLFPSSFLLCLPFALARCGVYTSPVHPSLLGPLLFPVKGQRNFSKLLSFFTGDLSSSLPRLGFGLRTRKGQDREEMLPCWQRPRS